jgi:hypothetical protein
MMRALDVVARSSVIPIAVPAVALTLQLTLAAAPARTPRAPRPVARDVVTEPRDVVTEPRDVTAEPRDAVDASGYPREQQARYALAKEKCTRCHGFARAVNSRLTPSEWKRHLKKMSLRPNTAMSDEQAHAILEFLKFHSTRK